MQTNYRFQGFYVSILLISMIVTGLRKILYEKKARGQVLVGNQQSNSGSNVELPQLNIVKSNDSMISLITVLIFSAASLIFLFLLSFYTKTVPGTSYYLLMLSFYAIFNFTPPLYFFKRIGKLKIAIDLVFEMFS